MFALCLRYVPQHMSQIFEIRQEVVDFMCFRYVWQSFASSFPQMSDPPHARQEVGHGWGGVGGRLQQAAVIEL